ncbi:MAG: hypothetical protein V1745_03300 [Patescibacteria group bacterium]
MKHIPMSMFWLVCIAFVVILIRDFTVYPQYSWGEAVLTTSIRLAVLLFTLYLTHLFRPGAWKRKGLTMFCFFLWILIIPHSFYNITQVRHISEICRLSQGLSFAGQCDHLLWSLLPLLLYGVGSFIVCLYSVDHLASLFKNPYRKLFLFGIFGYVSLGLAIGMYSRIDSIVSIFFDVRTNFKLIGSVMSIPDFWYNVLAYFVFANLVYFGGKALLGQRR